MKANKSTARLATWSAVAALVLFTLEGSVPAADAPAQVIPLITMESVELPDAIKNLGRQAGLNYLLDPSVSERSFAPDGKVIPLPQVTARYENTTAKDALLDLLKKHGLELIENPATHVTRVARIGQPTHPVDPQWVTGGTNEAVPLIVMDDVPLDVALQHLARTARLNVVINPAVARPPASPGGGPVLPRTVSIRLENITARQAIAALVENYDLAFSVDAGSGVVGIAPRQKAGAAPSAPDRGGGRGQ